jgi:hypothetical protein
MADTPADRIRAFLDERSTRAGRPHNNPLITSWHGVTLTAPDLRELLAENGTLRTANAALNAELDQLRPYAERGRAAAEQEAERAYRSDACEDCLCCTIAQCAEDRCATDSIGESMCPCTCG